MSDHEKSGPDQQGQQQSDNADRREALVKIGKYAAYTPPAMMIAISAARAQVPVSQAVPAPSPAPPV
jgi:hypothetical protein